MSYSIIIPSKDWNNLSYCLAAINKHEPQSRVIVIDDGLAVRPHSFDGMEITVIDGIKPFVYARNCNLGINAAGTDDVILLNDDALLETPGGFTALSRVSAEHADFGVISAVTNSTGNPAQCRRDVGLRIEPRMVCFIAAYISRAAIERVGLLDERFCADYGMDDDDMCLRVRQAGFQIGIYDYCFVDHKSLKSSFRGHGHCSFQKNLQIFKDKWGHDNWGRP